MFCLLVCVHVFVRPLLSVSGQDKQLCGAGQSPQLSAHARPLPADVPVRNQPGATECLSTAKSPLRLTLLPRSLQPVQVVETDIQFCQKLSIPH